MRPVLKGLLVWLALSVPAALWAARALKARSARPELPVRWEPLVRPVRSGPPDLRAARARQALPDQYPPNCHAPTDSSPVISP